MQRKRFIKNGALGLTGFLTIPIAKNAAVSKTDPLNPEVVKEFVVAGHNDLSKVKQMLKEIPNLLYSRHDWGGGDFEGAIEGAGHVGNKDIANYLIEQGARVNIFVLTMLGKTDLVKPVLHEYPNLIYANGPHGFTLLHHAKVGEKDSKELYDFLSEKGLRETQIDI